LDHGRSAQKEEKQDLSMLIVNRSDARTRLAFHTGHDPCVRHTQLTRQEHYLKTNPARLNNEEGPTRAIKNLELVSQAADWISDGDLVDRMIHG
jgi:hypothetical protein